MTATAVSVVIPAYQEDEAIRPVLDRIVDAITLDFEVPVVVDFPDDRTVAAVAEHMGGDARVRTLVSTYGRGPANAIRYGIDHAVHPVVVVTMADGSDDPRLIDPMARLVHSLAPAQGYSEDDIETLVQTITDQIMASV